MSEIVLTKGVVIKGQFIHLSPSQFPNYPKRHAIYRCRTSGVHRNLEGGISGIHHAGRGASIRIHIVGAFYVPSGTRMRDIIHGVGKFID